MTNARRLNPKPKAKSRKLSGNGNMPEARIIGGLPLGNMGSSSMVFKGIVEGREKPVALKISRNSYIGIERVWEDELENSIRLSRLLPNVASYYSMVNVMDWGKNPAFAMEIVSGFPIIDINRDCLDPGRFRGLLSRNALGQLKYSLKIASSNRWHTNDLQYFVLLEDQALNGKDYRRGDLILFDFCNWRRKNGSGAFDFNLQIKNLEKLVDDIENMPRK